MTPPDFAKHWARQLGASDPDLVQLQGGINNRVYRCGNGANAHVIKGYSPVVEGQRDRMQAEVEFLTYAAEVAPQYIPRLVHADTTLRCVVLEYLQGETYPEGVAPAATDIAAAVDFFRRLNADRVAAQRAVQMDAAEGFLKLTEHLGNVRERVAGMQTAHLPGYAQKQAEDTLHRLQASIDMVANRVEAAIASGAVEDGIATESRCVSPSDFGFHNMIRTRSGPKFIDFEFAGWDDPAKAAADFVLQPRVPVGRIAPQLLGDLDDNLQGIARREMLGGILRLKWTCIILAVLQPARVEMLLSNHPETDFNELMNQRLIKAANYLQEESPFGLH